MECTLYIYCRIFTEVQKSLQHKMESKKDSNAIDEFCDIVNKMFLAEKEMSKRMLGYHKKERTLRKPDTADVMFELEGILFIGDVSQYFLLLIILCIYMYIS